MASNAASCIQDEDVPDPSVLASFPSSGCAVGYGEMAAIDLRINDTATRSGIRSGCQLYSFIINVVVIGTVCVVGTFSNVVQFIVFDMDKRRMSMSFFFKALSVADSLFLLTVLPLYSAVTFRSYTGWTSGFDNVIPFLLVFVYPCASTARTAVVWITTVVGVNRYIAVCKPHRAVELCKLSRARKQVAVVVIVSVLYNIPKWFESEVKWHSGDNATYAATITHSVLGGDATYKIVYSNVCYVLFLLCVPFCVLCVISLRILHKVRAVDGRRTGMRASKHLNNNVTFVLTVVCFAFIVCQAPALVNQVLWNVLSEDARDCGGVQFYFSRISNALVIINSALNFVIHVTLNKDFKKRLFSLFTVTVRNDSHPMTVASRRTD
ncbi:hypothetical protein LSH36_1136g00002 [Paralvinella palmiformis]|uniref:G-protein coupled receptors family 1 profile domain-containing protein n=1 Tax=Paralvinella palmiformis TaxID=53620 RepID=A0AAD9MRB4_9ANNE|nr:hypothetical protein LSH36_1136g00002 [Paralvinella palmiformis]